MKPSAREKALEPEISTMFAQLNWAMSIASEILANPDPNITFCAGLLAGIQAILGDTSWLEDAARIATESQNTSGENRLD